MFPAKLRSRPVEGQKIGGKHTSYSGSEFELHTIHIPLGMNIVIEEIASIMIITIAYGLRKNTLYIS